MSLQAKYTDLIQRWGFSQHIYIYFFFIPEDHSHVFYSSNVSLIVFSAFLFTIIVNEAKCNYNQGHWFESLC